MRAAYLEQPAPADEPPTGLLDLAAIRAALGAEPGGEVNPAAVAWLAGNDEPVFGDIYADEPEPVFDPGPNVPQPDEGAIALREAIVDERAATGLEPAPEPEHEHVPRLDGTCALCGEHLEPAPVEYDCEVLGNAMHTDGPCGPAQHPEPEPVADVSVPDLEPEPVPESPQPVPAPPVTPPQPAPVFIPERQPVLTWAPRHDERSRAYGVRPRLLGSAPLTDHELPVGPIFDQGSEGACFGMAGTAARNTIELLAGRPARYTADDALTLYRLAQRRDEVPGEAYTGTSVTGGMSAGVELGAWGGYLWDFGTRDVAQTILKLQRPVIVGVTWLSGMYDTGPGGLVQLTGDDEGLGHCLSVFGIRLKGPQGQPGPYFCWQNSWSTSYGDDGIGYIHHRDLAALLHGTGEAAVPTDTPVR
jgi:hypothetical protein